MATNKKTAPKISKEDIDEIFEKPTEQPVYDSGSIGWSLLGIFADPIWAFVVYLCWKDYKPKTAKKALIGAIIGLTIRVIFIFLIVSAFMSFYHDIMSEYQALLSEYATLY